MIQPLRLLVIATVFFALTASAQTSQPRWVWATASIVEFPIPTPRSRPQGLVSGADGNIWFAEIRQIGRVSTSGEMTEFAVPPKTEPNLIARGPDGNIWFTARWYESGQTSAKIGRITPSGDVSEFFVSERREPTGICLGPDGNLWFTQTATVIDEPDHIGRITSAGAITNFPLPAWSRWPIYITPGTGSDLWFTDNIASKIGRITIDGAVTQFDIPTPNAGPTEIVVGPDNLVWFAESLGNKLGRMTQTGTFSEIPLPAGSAPFSIIVGPDQNLWFSAFYGKVIAFIAPDETITAVRLPAELSHAHHLALGSDGNIWFSNNEGNAIGYLDVASIEAIPDEDVPSLSPVALATLMATIAVCGCLAARAAQP